jgi:acetyl esterase/lipase
VFSSLVAASLALSSPPETPIREIDGLAYVADGNEKHKLDLYLPSGAKNPRLLVFVHGGAWISGDKSQYKELGRFFSSRGVATAVVNYRLSRDPAVRHPDHITDVVDAIGWLEAHSRDYGYDRGHTFLLGHSAGAHMAAVLTAHPGMLKGAKMAGYIGLEGIYDLVALNKTFPTYHDWFLATAFGPESGWRAASPTGLPVRSKTPWLVLHSTLDELVDEPQARLWAAHLRDAGVTAQLVVRDFGKHFDTVGSLEGKTTPDLGTRILDFVARD